MIESPRYALYYTPPSGSRLAAFGNAVLGYDSATGAAVAHPPELAGIASVSAAPRLYGFHATLKPPMRLAAGAGESDLIGAVEAWAADHPPVPAGRLAVALLGRFVALVPEEAPPELNLFAAECVAVLDPLRAPLDPDERARRQPGRLSPRARALLDRWGYPHVFEAFRFHLTLTGALPEAERAAWLARLARAYEPDDLVVDAVTLLRQDGGAPFRVLRRVGLSG